MAVLRRFRMSSLGVCFGRRRALLLNPPVYDTQYWAEWSQPYGLLRIAALLRRAGLHPEVPFFFFSWGSSELRPYFIALVGQTSVHTPQDQQSGRKHFRFFS